MKKPLPNRDIRPKADLDDPGYPRTRAPQPMDPSRRRFIRQVVTGGAALGVLGGAQLVQAQTAPDFSVLDAHDVTPAPPAPALAEGLSQPQEMMAAPVVAPSAVEPTSQQTLAVVAETWVTEDRALWVEPGYLVLVRWSRPESDTTAVTVFEASGPDVQAHLAAAVTSPSTQLHDSAQLRTIEDALVTLLTPRMVPAYIEKLHLDHDCALVCGPTSPEYPEVMGIVAPPSY